MSDRCGPATSSRALDGIGALATALGDKPPGFGLSFDLERLEWFDLRNMLVVARAVAQAALNRTESRGAHQREDFPGALPQWQRHQSVDWRNDDLHVAAPQAARALAS
jgi:succinate dehydrogenase / fumarate reductase, flavoprotein subunit